MKLATLRDGKRDGALIVVSRDLTRAVKAMDIAPTLQYALDNWQRSAPKLELLYRQLSDGRGISDAFAFNPKAVSAPLPRAYQFLDASGYIHHIELMRKARGEKLPPDAMEVPQMYQGSSDHFYAPHDDMPFVAAQKAGEDWGLDFEAEIAIITDDVPMGVTVEEAEQHILMVMLCNDISLRAIAKHELARGFGFVQAKPPSAFSPVAVSLEELGAYWHSGKLHLPLRTTLNGRPFGQPDAGVGMTFNFAALIVHAARTRPLAAGTIIGSGVVSNAEPNAGHSCILEKRTCEKFETGEITTAFLRSGDTVRIDMLDDYHNSVFGAIEQTAVPYRGGKTRLL